MSELQEAVEKYIALRRSLGFELREPARLLRSFIAFMDGEGASHISVELAVRWARQPASAQPATWARRLSTVRRFALWHRAESPKTEVPPEGLLPYRYRRKQPYIYSDSEIRRLVRVSGRLPSPRGLRALTYSTLFGLLAVTGMRLSEALALDRKDVDLDEAVLTVRRTKFAKSRLVPVHATTRAALLGYTKARDRVLAAVTTQGFFLAERGTRITQWSARDNFVKVSREIGLRAKVKGHRYGHGPRIHDLRHRFAVKTLINWYRAGLDVEREIPKLATYLGHAHFSDTYWYLEAVPELLQLATERLAEMHTEVTT